MGTWLLQPAAGRRREVRSGRDAAAAGRFLSAVLLLLLLLPAPLPSAPPPSSFCLTCPFCGGRLFCFLYWQRCPSVRLLFDVARLSARKYSAVFGAF